VTVLVALLVGSSPVYATGHHGRAAHGGTHQAKKHLGKKRATHRKRPHRRPSTQGDTPSPAATATAAAPVPSTQLAPAVRGTAVRGTSAVSPSGWLTTGDATRRLDPLTAAELKPSTSRSAVHVAVDDTTRYQSMDGFGAALTESSAHLLMQLKPAARTAALRSLFDPVTGAGMDLVRLPLGSSDFALSRYTYDDLPAGQTDPTLSRFTLAHDDAEIVPVLQEALQINPSLRVLGTPWSAPAWMKSNQSLLGGTLADGYTDVYAGYLVRTVQALRARQIPIRFLTLGNEPRYAPADYPGMLLSPQQEAALAGAVAGRLAQAGISDVQLIGYDHNWDDTSYATSLLADPAAGSALAGTAFHCYAGDPSAQSTVHDAAPDKGIWFTECSGGSWSPEYAGNLGWDANTLLLGATRSWARSVLLWNLALDPAGGPHTGGCSSCRGVLTIDPATGAVTRNVEYDVLGQAGKGVRPGAVRVATPESVYGVKTVAYVNPDGTHALTAYNSWQSDQTLVVDAGSRHVGAPLPAGSVVTLVW
jgi:glucosylceramidase